MRPTVTCIVLNWNSRDYLEDCLTSLLASDYDEAEYVVIDNASIDESVEFLSRRFPSVKVIRNETNLGFAGGNNVGLQELESDFAVLVNPDAIVSPELVSDLIASFRADDRIGVAGCKTYYPGSMRIQHAGGYIEYPRGVPGHIGLDELDEGQYDRLTDVDYVTGAVFAIRRQLLEDTGLFDPGYFLYFEEADLCFRARKAGYRVVLIPGAGAEHIESAVSKKGSRFFHNQLHTSRWRYLVKHYPIEGLLKDTFPAERTWLHKLDPVVRSAASTAYRNTILNLPSIVDRREKETKERIPDSQQAAVREGLEELRTIAFKQAIPTAEDLARISDLAGVHEEPFHSNLPIIGSAVAGLRDLWSQVALKPFMRPLLDQQQEINRSNIELLSSSIEQLNEKRPSQLERDRLLSGLLSDLHRLNKTLTRLNERSDRLDQEYRDEDDDQSSD
jgi:GT2 family glycosyltransferase